MTHSGRRFVLVQSIWMALLLFGIPRGTRATATAELTQTVRGRVTDAIIGTPLPGATVYLPDTAPAMGTMTNNQGEFRLPEVPIGRLTLRVTYIGYHPVQLSNLTLTTGRELVLDIGMEEAVMQVEGVEIRGTTRKDRPVNEMALVSARSFTIEETERYAGSLGDPSRMAANFAGVSSASDQRNDIIIRGNSPMGLLWRLDGVEIPNPNHFGSLGSTGGPVSMLNNNLLTNSDFYTGAFPAEFGNALAGAFDLRLRSGNAERREYVGQVGFNGFELGAEGPWRRFPGASYLVNGRYSTLAIMDALGLDMGTGTAVPQYKDASFKLDVPTERRGYFTLFGLGGTSYIEMLDSKGDPAAYGFSGTDLYFGGDTGVIGLTHTGFSGDHARFTSTVSVSGIRNDVELYQLEDELDFPNVIEAGSEVRFSLSSRYRRKRGARHTVNAGAVFDHLWVEYDGREYDKDLDGHINYLKNSGTMPQTRAFGEWQHRHTDRLTLNSGLHAHLLLFNNTWALEPRVALDWQATDRGNLNLGAGMHSQTQPRAIYFMSELADTLDNTYVLTNDHLDFSRSLHLVAGYEHRLHDKLRVKLEAYYQYLYDLPVSEERPEYSTLVTGGGFSYWVYDHMQNAGTGRNYGVELTLERFLHQGLYYLFTGSLFDATYRGFDGVKRNSSFNNNFIVNALAGYEWDLDRRHVLAVDVKGVLAGGSRYVPIDEELSRVDNEAVYVWDQAFQQRHNAYFRLNARLSYRRNGPRYNQEWALDLQNLTNHRNIFMRTWNSYKQEVTTNYQMEFLPMMTYRIRF